MSDVTVTPSGGGPVVKVRTSNALAALEHGVEVAAMSRPRSGVAVVIRRDS